MKRLRDYYKNRDLCKGGIAVAHKIKVTGDVQKIRQVKNPTNPQTWLWCLDIKTGGSPASPKGLPKASDIEYTALLNDRTYTRLISEMQEHRLKLKGSKVAIDAELTIDMPMDIVPGEIGLIVYKIDSVDISRIKREQEEGTDEEDDVQERQVSK
jgi:hypothetical protein